MTECVFCKIAAGDLTCYRVYEDDLFIGFLDITPRTLGHTLLIPKKHFTWVYDVPEFERYWGVVNKITKAMHSALAPFFVSYVTHGLEVPHAHIHIMPRQRSDTAFVPPPISVDTQKMTETAESIKNALEH